MRLPAGRWRRANSRSKFQSFKEPRRQRRRALRQTEQRRRSWRVVPPHHLPRRPQRVSAGKLQYFLCISRRAQLISNTRFCIDWPFLAFWQLSIVRSFFATESFAIFDAGTFSSIDIGVLFLCSCRSLPLYRKIRLKRLFCPAQLSRVRYEPKFCSETRTVNNCNNSSRHTDSY